VNPHERLYTPDDSGYHENHVAITYYVFHEYSLVLVLNRMSKKLKSAMKKLFGGKSMVGTVHTLFSGCSTAISWLAEMMKHMDSSLVGRTICFQRDEIIFFIFIPFCNMNLLISLHSIFQDEESLGQEEEVEAAGLEEDLEASGLKKTTDGGG
jgi:hypothetical protein